MSREVKALTATGEGQKCHFVYADLQTFLRLPVFCLTLRKRRFIASCIQAFGACGTFPYRFDLWVST